MPETPFSTEPSIVYGTLHPDRAPAEIRRLIPLGPATILGTLHNLGEYPALILNGKTGLPLQPETPLTHPKTILRAFAQQNRMSSPKST
jgi:hypothetical protein